MEHDCLKDKTLAECEELRGALDKKIGGLKESARKNLFVSGERTPTQTLRDGCGHTMSDTEQSYPSFNVGLSKPLALLLKLCPKCAKSATVDSILTPARWERMKRGLESNGEKVPNRKDVTMNIEKAVQNKDFIDYTYAWVA